MFQSWACMETPHHWCLPMVSAQRWLSRCTNTWRFLPVQVAHANPRQQVFETVLEWLVVLVLVVPRMLLLLLQTALPLLQKNWLVYRRWKDCKNCHCQDSHWDQPGQALVFQIWLRKKNLDWQKCQCWPAQRRLAQWSELVQWILLASATAAVLDLDQGLLGLGLV